MGHREAGARMVAICWTIDNAIGHGDADSDLRSLIGLCAKLGFDQKRIQQTINEAVEAYTKDRGRSLLEQTFPPAGPARQPPAA